MQNSDGSPSNGSHHRKLLSAHPVAVMASAFLLVSGAAAAAESYVDQYPELFLFTAEPGQGVAAVPNFQTGSPELCSDEDETRGCAELYIAYFQAMTLNLLNALPQGVHVNFLHAGPSEQAEIVNFLAGQGFFPQDYNYIDVVDRSTVRAGEYLFFPLNSSDGMVFVDAKYNADRRPDDAAPTRIALDLNALVYRPPLLLYRGLIEFSGDGVCVVSSKAYSFNATLSLSQVDVLLRRYFGCERIVSLQPLTNEPTGRLDLLFRFTDSRTMVLAEYSTEQDNTNRLVLDHDATLLQGLVDDGFRLIRAPMPPHSSTAFPSYLTFQVLPGTVLVPQFPNYDDNEEAALAVLAPLFPDKELVPFPCEQLVVETGVHLSAFFATTPQQPLNSTWSSPELLCESYDLVDCPDLCLDACLEESMACLDEVTAVSCKGNDLGCIERSVTTCVDDWICQEGKCVAPPGPCDDMPAGGRCNGDTKEFCAGPSFNTVDCAALGLFCIINDAEEAECSAACTHLCQDVGASRCVLGEAAVETCELSNQGCNVWVSAACPNGEACVDGECHGTLPEVDEEIVASTDVVQDDVGVSAGFGAASSGCQAGTTGIPTLWFLMGLMFAVLGGAAVRRRRLE